MDRRETVESNQAIEFAEGLLDPGFAADVVAGGEDVRGIETNTEPLRLAHVFDEVSDLLEPVTETRTLPSRCLQRDPRFHLWNFAKHAVDRSDNFFEAGFFASADVGARMQN